MSASNISPDFNDQTHAERGAKLAAIERALAVIEFEMDGTIVTANDSFLGAMGYALDEIQGKHHSMFVDDEYKRSQEYKAFWEKLNRGEFESKEYKRLGKGGKEIWIRASYNPITDENGRPYRVVKIATDVTSEKLQSADFSGQIAAIGKAQAVIEFNMDGTIITANENFLNAVGYRLDEIQGQHHRMFVEQAVAGSPEYSAFWEKLNRGEYEASEYKRLGKGGKEIWIQASYNPILDLNGKPFKVVKYATDVTAAKLQNADFSGQIAAIGKAQAVIEFNMDGTIIGANENFLTTLGYSLEEVQGKHHRMFVSNEFAGSNEYRSFWEKLNRGEYEAAEYQRLGKNGREVWIQASYNPILNLSGKPFKVVKYATDLTEQKRAAAALQGDISEYAVKLSAAAEELTSVSNEMSAQSEQTSTQANVVSTASREVDENVQTVAAGTEELSASIQEISNSAQTAASVAREAVQFAGETNKKVSKLSESSAEIGQVIKVITSIAQQTNLLALNATIEAARAGEAGKSFAVVANEVKELAKATAKATEDISSKILAIQTDTKESVLAIEKISEIIATINDTQTSIAGAVEQQASTTSDMARNVSQANESTKSIVSNIEGVATAAGHTSKGAEGVNVAASELSTMAAQLQDLVSRLKA